MKLLITLITSFILLIYSAVADETDCSKFDKVSKEYAKCNSLLLKKKSIEIKEKASKEIIIAKKKFSKFDLKKKLLKFKNSKSHKEYKEN
ncbi:hypothetical protein OAS36_00355 [Candidatus Pelagibacter sp.]|nr:hypothetical protein [Candidatus Pelagibacter sp.]